MSTLTTLCPACGRPGGALSAELHCKNKHCTWNECNCGVTYDRVTGSGYRLKPPMHYPPTQ